MSAHQNHETLNFNGPEEQEPENLDNLENNGEQLDNPDQRLKEMREEMDVDVTKNPDGETRLSARLSSGGQENVISVTFGQQGEKVVINGVETSDPEEIEKVNELFEINEGFGQEEEEGLEDTADSDEAFDDQSLEAADDVKRELQGQGTDISDEELVERRASELNSKLIEQDTSQPEQASEEDQEEVGRAILAEQLMDNDQETAEALAETLQETGDPFGANRIRQYAFEARHTTGGPESLENDADVLQLFGEEAEKAMQQTGQTVEELEDKAAEEELEDSEEKRAA